MDHLGPDAKDHEVPSCKDEMLSQHKLAPDFFVLTEGGTLTPCVFGTELEGFAKNKADWEKT